MAAVSMNAVYERTNTKLALALTKLQQLPADYASKGTITNNYNALKSEYDALKSMLAETLTAISIATSMIMTDPTAALKLTTGQIMLASLNGRGLALEAKVSELNTTLDNALISVTPVKPPSPGIFSNIPNWVLYAGGAVVALGAFLAFRKKK